MKEKYLDYLESKLYDLSLFDDIGNIESHVENWTQPCVTLLSAPAVCPGVFSNQNPTGAPNWASSVTASVFGGPYGWPTIDRVTELFMNVIKVSRNHFEKCAVKKYKTCLTMNSIVLINVLGLETWIHFGTKSKDKGKIIKRIHFLMPKLSLILISLLWAATTLH